MAEPAPTFAELVSLGQSEAQSVAPRLSFNNGDVSLAIVHAAGAMADWIVGWAAGEVRRLFFGGAKGDDLDEIINDRLKMQRNGATAAYGDVVFFRTSPGSSGVIPAGTQVATQMDANGERKVYALDSDLPYGSGTFSVSGRATAVTAGRDSTAAGQLQLSIIDDIGDSTIHASSNGFAGGNDKERDEDYLVRAVNSWVSQRRGTLQAIETGATVDGIATIARAVENENTGLVSVYISDAAGGSSLAMEYDVRKSLEDYRAAGSIVNIVGGQAATLYIGMSIDDYAHGFDVAASAPLISDSITNRVNSLRVGQDLTLDMIRTAAIAPFASEIYKVSFTLLRLDGVDLSMSQDISANGKLITLGTQPTIVDGKE